MTQVVRSTILQRTAWNGVDEYPGRATFLSLEGLVSLETRLTKNPTNHHRVLLASLTLKGDSRTHGIV